LYLALVTLVVIFSVLKIGFYSYSGHHVHIHIVVELVGNLQDNF
jgi:hypothetical protein